MCIEEPCHCNNHNFAWAIEQMGNGKKVRCSSWPKEQYYYQNEQTILNERQFKPDYLLREAKRMNWGIYEEEIWPKVFELKNNEGAFKFKVDCKGYITIINEYSKSMFIIDSLPSLYEAVELSKEIRSKL